MRKFIGGVVIGGLLMSGTALAASHYLITSTKQIKPSVLKQIEDKPSTLTTRTIKGSIVTVYGDETADFVQGGTATCPSGTVVVGGGFDQGPVPIGQQDVADSEPENNGWYVEIQNNTESTGTFVPVAVCAKG